MRGEFNRKGDASVKTSVTTGESKEKKKALSPVTVRYSENERRLLKRFAGDASLSVYIRACTLKNDRRHNSTPIKDKEALGRVLGLLGQSRIANNLNQIAKAANSGSLLLDEETILKIEQSYLHVCSMRNHLMAALGLRGMDQQ